jgi:ribosomal protein L5
MAKSIMQTRYREEIVPALMDEFAKNIPAPGIQKIIINIGP